MSPLWIILAAIAGGCILLILNHASGSVFGIENNRFASLIWLAAWAAVVSAAILPRNGRWREFARNVIIWLTAILLLMTAYLYRYELQDVASRLTAGLIPGSPISSASFDGREVVTLFRTGDRHFTARGSVNGAPVLFIVDTGANVVVLTETDARNAGIDTASLEYSVPVTTANGRTTAARTRIDSLAIGNIVRHDILAMVARPQSLETSLLGMNFLASLHGFSIYGDRLVLTD